MRRLDDWRARLAAEMDRQRREPFEWNRHDCALGLACGAVEAITGTNPGERWRGRYTTAPGALRVLRREGYDSLADLVAAMLPEIHPSAADIGDIGLIETEGPLKQALCVVDTYGLIVLTESGLGRRPRTDMIRAFKIG